MMSSQRLSRSFDSVLNLLHDFDPQRDVNATPRSWVEGVSDVIGVVPADAEYECFKGAVGEGACCRVRWLPQDTS